MHYAPAILAGGGDKNAHRPTQLREGGLAAGGATAKIPAASTPLAARSFLDLAVAPDRVLVLTEEGTQVLEGRGSESWEGGEVVVETRRDGDRLRVRLRAPRTAANPSQWPLGGKPSTLDWVDEARSS